MVSCWQSKWSGGFLLPCEWGLSHTSLRHLVWGLLKGLRSIKGSLYRAWLIIVFCHGDCQSNRKDSTLYYMGWHSQTERDILKVEQLSEFLFLFSILLPGLMFSKYNFVSKYLITDSPSSVLLLLLTYAHTNTIC